MILKIFNHYIPIHKLFFFFLESLFILGMVVLGAYLRFFSDPGSFSTYEGVLPKALLIVALVQLCLYHFDLYDLRTFRSNLELAIRLLQSLGVSSILLAAIYYLFPVVIIGRGVFFVRLLFMGVVI